MKTSLSRRQHLMLGLVFVFALCVRGVYLWGQARNNPLYDHPMMDARIHHEWAERIASGEGLGDAPFFRAPLYYYVIALLYWVFGPLPAIARWFGCVVGAVSCYLIARLGAALDGFRTALLAGLAAAVYWPLIYFDGEPLTVGLEVFLDTLLLLALVLAALRGSRPLFAVAGIVLGLSAITRPNVLAMAPAIAAWLFVVRSDHLSLRRTTVGCALTLVGVAVVVFPVTLRNYFVSGEWVLIATNGGVNFYIGNNPSSDGRTAVVPGTRKSWSGGFADTHRIAERELGRPLSESQVSRYWYDRAFEWIRSNPTAYLRHLFQKFRLFWSTKEIPNNQPIEFFARLSGISSFCPLGFSVVVILGAGGLVLVCRE